MKSAMLMRSLQRSSSTSMHSKAALRNSSPSSILCLKGPKSTSLQTKRAKLAHHARGYISYACGQQDVLSASWQHTYQAAHINMLTLVCMCCCPAHRFLVVAAPGQCCSPAMYLHFLRSCLCCLASRSMNKAADSCTLVLTRAYAM